jgi:hypothetical protein
MQEWMRKHRRLIMFFILLFIGVPMVIFLGMPSIQPSTETAEDNVIAKVGNIPIMESEFRQRLDAMAAQRTQQGMERPTYQELDADGTATRVLEQLTDAALVRIQEQQRPFAVETDLLAKQMQKEQWFQDEDGNFNHEAWNEWVQSIDKWDEIYADLQEGVARQVFLGTITAPAGRILESKIDEELLASQTKLKFRHGKVELLVVPTEEELQAHYNENPDTYREPEVHQAEFVQISLIPDVPEIAYEIIERARNGEDFAALANEYSDEYVEGKEPAGGVMGWRREGDFVSPHLRPFFALGYNEVSDPVLGPTGYIIYKVDEERTNEVTGEREINGSQILLNVEIDSAIMAERETLANEISTKLLEAGNAQSVADEYGLELFRTDYFNRSNLEIENIHHEDIYTFRGQILADMEASWVTVKAKRHIYIGKIVDTKQGDLPPFDEVREKVVDNVKNERKRTEEYQATLEEKVNQIKARAKTLDEITGLDADVVVEIGETEEPVSIKDSLFQKKIYVQTTSIFDALKDKEVGEMGEPIRGFLGAYWFFELLERDAPTAEALAELKEERKEIKDRIVQTAQYEILSDYTKDLRERMMPTVSYTQDTAALDRILGRNLEGETEESSDVNVTDAAVTEDAPAPASGDTSSEGEVADGAVSEAAAEEEKTETSEADDTTPETAVEEEVADDMAVETDVSVEETVPDAQAVSSEDTENTDSPAAVVESVEAVQDDVTETAPAVE